MTIRAIDQLLIDAVDEGALDSVGKALAGGADPNIRIEGEMPLIHLTAIRGQSEAVAALIAGGADVNARDADGRTALLFTSWLGSSDEHVNILNQLINAGADINAADSRGRTGLDWAAQMLNRKMTRELVANGAQPSHIWRRAVERLLNAPNRGIS